MTKNVTRKDKRKAPAIKRQRELEGARKAESIQELEMVFAAGQWILVDYYVRHPITWFFARLGFRSKKRQKELLNRARIELAEVNYDYDQWQEKYGAFLKKG